MKKKYTTMQILNAARAKNDETIELVNKALVEGVIEIAKLKDEIKRLNKELKKNGYTKQQIERDNWDNYMSMHDAIKHYGISTSVSSAMIIADYYNTPVKRLKSRKYFFPSDIKEMMDKAYEDCKRISDNKIQHPTGINFIK